MVKKCIICNGDATLFIKGTSEFYCENCAKENFDDLSYLEKLDSDKKKKEMIEKAINKEEADE